MRPCCGSQPQYRSIAEHLNLRFLYECITWKCVIGYFAAAAPIHRRKVPEARGLRQIWITDIHHDDAGKAPHDHQQANCDTEIAVNEEERTDHRAAADAVSEAISVIGREGPPQPKIVCHVRIAGGIVDSVTERRVV